MKRIFIVLATLITVCLFTFSLSYEPVQAQCPGGTFVIDGAQANAGAGTGSTATGTGLITFDTTTNLLTWNISYNANDLAGSVTAAHFHGPAAANANAGVQISIGTANPAISSATLSAGQAADLLAGLWYVNIHTTAFGGGEIRGQVSGCTTTAVTLQNSAAATMNPLYWLAPGLGMLILTSGLLILRRRKKSTIL